jgi:uncharacterized OB-fold protein
MGGIKNIGVYIPATCFTEGILKRIKGERRIGNYDEDSLTMGFSSTERIGVKDVKELYFISSTPPFHIRSPSSFLATALDIEKNCIAFDVMGGGKSLIDLFSKSFKNDFSTLIILSDKRKYQVDTPDFYASGDGAVSFLISKDDSSIEFISSKSISYESLSEWKDEEDEEIKTSESKAEYELRKEIMRECLEIVLRESGLKKEEIFRIFLPFPDFRLSLEIGSACGFSKSQVHSNKLLNLTGWTGYVHPFLEFVYSIETEDMEEKFVLLAGLGGGFSACVLKVKRNAKSSITKGINDCLKRRFEIKDLTILYKITGDLKYEKVKPFSPIPLHYREIEECIKLKGQRCSKCGAIQYPWRYLCYKCESTDFEFIPLSRKGKIYTFTRDYLNPVPIQPLTMAVVELEGGGRFYGQMTDVHPQDVRIGMDVSLTLRRLHEGGDFINYFWKIIPCY